MRTRVSLRFAVAFALAVLLPTTFAQAFWSAGGFAATSVATGTLNAPVGVTAVWTSGTGDVSVGWTAPSGSPAPTGYYVTRASGSTLAAACGTSAANPITATSCTDSGVPVGVYGYRVVAIYRSWTATSAAQSATVSQASQTITFTSTPSSPAVGGSYTVTANGGGSSNPVVFTSTTTSVCTVSGSAVSFVHAGTCTINANQAGSIYYTAAPTAVQGFSVTRASQTITFTSTAPTNAVVGGATYTATAKGGDSGNAVFLSIDSVSTSVCSISSGVVTFNHAGTCVVDATQSGNADYNSAPRVQQSIAVGKAAQAITVSSTPPPSANVGGWYTVMATSNSGLAVAITLDATSTGCSLSGNTAYFVSAGTCKIDANQAGNADWLPAAQMQQSITVTKRDQSISFTSTAPSPAIAGTTYTVSATATSGLTVSFNSLSSSVCTSGGTNGATITFVNTGTCTIVGNQGGSSLYNAAPQVQQSFSVTATLVITSAYDVCCFGGKYLSVSGSGGQPYQTITVRVCSGTQSSCPAGSFWLVQTMTVTVAWDGTWTIHGNYLTSGSYTIQAYQSAPPRISAVYVF